MKKPFKILLVLTISICLLLTGCNNSGLNKKDTDKTSESTKGGSDNTETKGSDKSSTSGNDSGSSSKDNSKQKETESAEESSTVASGELEIPDLTEGVNTLQVTVLEGTADCYRIENQTLTFSGLTTDTVCSISGEFDGQITVDAGDDYKFELEMNGATVFNASGSPITVLSGDKFTLSAKKDSKNYIFDTREAVDDTDETVHSAAVYSVCDMNIEGKGELSLISAYNNGIMSKDDLNVKNLTLLVSCLDNALKGNDSVTIESGNLCLIARSGDAIKSSNTDISEKGNQRGSVIITGGEITLYAACDGIDAAYNADITGEAVVNIFTDSYSPYTGNVEKEYSSDTPSNVRFISFNLDSYSFSVKYYNSDDDFYWANATFYKSVNSGRSTYYFYTIEKRTDYKSVQFFIYDSAEKQGQDTDCLVSSDYMTWNDSYDTFAMEASNRGVSYNWTNYSTAISQGGSGFGGRGPGGMSDGNTDKGEYSTKGIKAGNEILISGGQVAVKSYDDAVHASSGQTLENGSTSTGNVKISEGSLTVFSKDDGVHADGELLISGGSVTVTGSYEGLEGNTITVSGGTVNITSSDDGMNSCATTGAGITFSGGSVFVYAGGDGIDSNSRSQYQGIVFEGGEVMIVSTTSMNSSIDTENGYTYTGGKVLAVCPSGGMTGEVTNCKNFSSIAAKKSMSLKANQVLTVKSGKNELLSMTMPCSISGFIVYLGESGVSFTAE